jgi:hypothetical protein
MLLNPKGSHDQGDRFLRAFLEMLYAADFPEKRKITEFLNLDLKKAVVQCEEYLQGRRIDISVTINNKRFGIENKIEAGDQTNQIYDYLKTGDFDFLIYISPDRERPDDISIPLAECEEMINKGKLLIMKHKYSSASAYAWLKRCAEITESDKIRWYLREVMTLIDIIYEEDSYMNNAVAEILLKNNDVFDAFIKLKPHQRELEDVLVYNFFSQLKIKLTDKLKNNAGWEIFLNPKIDRYVKNPSCFVVKNKDWNLYLSFDFTEYKQMYCLVSQKELWDVFEKIFGKDGSNQEGYMWIFIKELPDCKSPDCMKKLRDLLNNSENSELSNVIRDLCEKITKFVDEVGKKGL